MSEKLGQLWELFPSNQQNFQHLNPRITSYGGHSPILYRIKQIDRVYSFGELPDTNCHSKTVIFLNIRLAPR